MAGNDSATVQGRLGRADGACGVQNIRTMTIGHIVQMEWDFFQDVNNAGGRASCQDMPETFSIMRTAQFVIWTDEMLHSYYDDLRTAQLEKRNPLAEKYAYMMRFTHPDEFEQIKDKIPEIPAYKEQLIDRIVGIQILWAEDVRNAYPHFASRGRAIRSKEDGACGTSIETYSRGELATCSEHTLELMASHFEAAQDAGCNLQISVDDAMARSYGYGGLAAAEEALADGGSL